jgi:hypothetical protein
MPSSSQEFIIPHMLQIEMLRKRRRLTGFDFLEHFCGIWARVLVRVIFLRETVIRLLQLALGKASRGHIHAVVKVGLVLCSKVASKLENGNTREKDHGIGHSLLVGYTLQVLDVVEHWVEQEQVKDYSKHFY